MLTARDYSMAGPEELEAPDEKTPLLAASAGAARAGGTAAAGDAPSQESAVAQKHVKCKTEKPMHISRYVNSGAPWYLVVRSSSGICMHILTALGAYFYVQGHYEDQMPKCRDGNNLDGILPWFLATGICDVCAWCYCSYPLVASWLIVSVFKKNLYEARLYYECLLHRIVLDYEEIDYMANHYVMILAPYLLLSLTFLFVREQEHHADLSPKELRSIVFGSLAYLSPVLTSVAIISTFLQIEAHLIPLSKFLENDPHEATSLLDEGEFIPEGHLRIAFEEFDESLVAGTSKAPQNEQEYFHEVLTRAMKEVEAGKARYAEENPEGPTQDSFVDKLALSAGFSVAEEYATTMGQARRDEQTAKFFTFWWFLTKGLWSRRLLTSEHFEGIRAQNFKKWAKIFQFATSVIICILGVTYVFGFVQFLLYQRILPKSALDSDWAQYFVHGLEDEQTHLHSHAKSFLKGLRSG